MDSVTAGELHRKTAEVLARVKAGESLEISQDGRPVAHLLPAALVVETPLLERLVAQGRAIPAANPGPIPPTPRRDTSEEDVPLSMALAQLRDDERC
jgi:prevent-host-death family protein